MGSTRTSWSNPSGGTAGQLRASYLETLETCVKEAFSSDASLQSALLSVAQYWADEADDAVHATVIFSERQTPLWPHDCYRDQTDADDAAADVRRATDRCKYCDERKVSFSWMFDDNGDGIVAFQSCCAEGGSGGDDESYLPYAVVRRGEGDSLALEIVGGPVRPWLDAEPGRAPTLNGSRAHDAPTATLLAAVYANASDDGPRAVLADHLQERGDPLGEYIALALAKGEAARTEISAHASDLEAEHARAWLGPLANVAPPERTLFARGFVRSLHVHLAEATLGVLAAPEWGTVEELWFLPHGEHAFSRTMRSLRRVGSLGEAGLGRLRASGVGASIEDLQITADSEEMLRELAETELPRLRRLAVRGTVGGASSRTEERRNPFTGQMQSFPVSGPAGRSLLTPTTLERLLHAPFFSRLEELAVMSIEPAVIAEWLARPPGARPSTLTFVAASPTHQPAGFRLRVSVDTVFVDVASVGGETRPRDLTSMVRALPASFRQVRVLPSRWFDPTAADLEQLGRAFGRETTRA